MRHPLPISFFLRGSVEPMALFSLENEDLCAAHGAFYTNLFSANPIDAAAQVELLSHFSSPFLT